MESLPESLPEQRPDIHCTFGTWNTTTIRLIHYIMLTHTVNLWQEYNTKTDDFQRCPQGTVLEPSTPVLPVNLGTRASALGIPPRQLPPRCGGALVCRARAVWCRVVGQRVRRRCQACATCLACALLLGVCPASTECRPPKCGIR